VKLRCAAVAALLLAAGVSAPASAGGAQPHPGDEISVEGGGGSCTLGFLLKGSDGRRYMSTAGHCLLGVEQSPPRTWRPGAGPPVTTADGQIGRVVFAEHQPSQETADSYDFALIRLDDGVRPSPEIRLLGAPTGLNDERGSSPVALRTHGHSVFGAVAPERELQAPNTRHQDHVYAHGPVFTGDSGAPVVDAEGRAVGTVLGAGLGQVGVGTGGVSLTHDGAPNIIGRLAPVVQHASRALGLRLTLVTQKQQH
jgi:hypothetical protein